MKRSPAAALWLSLIPGAGHVYVGQLSKGALLILLVASAIHLVDSGAEMFGIVIPFLWLYAMLDAHRGAQEFNRIVEAGGEPPRNTSFAFSKWWGVLLIGLGVLFTLDNADILDIDDLAMLWPLGLVALGIYILKRPAKPELATPPPRPAASSPSASGASGASTEGSQGTGNA